MADAENEKKQKKTGLAPAKKAKAQDPFIRAENEDDDGYDPYSDRLPEREPLFEPDPWN